MSSSGGEGEDEGGKEGSEAAVVYNLTSTERMISACSGTLLTSFFGKFVFKFSFSECCLSLSLLWTTELEKVCSSLSNSIIVSRLFGQCSIHTAVISVLAIRIILSWTYIKLFEIKFEFTAIF